MQEQEERAQRKLLEQQLPQTGVKTTALPRPNSYMPTDIRKYISQLLNRYRNS